MIFVVMVLWSLLCAGAMVLTHGQTDLDSIAIAWLGGMAICVLFGGVLRQGDSSG
jgi:hypothetical protein